jgi:hypothetical protein
MLSHERPHSHAHPARSGITANGLGLIARAQTEEEARHLEHALTRNQVVVVVRRETPALLAATAAAPPRRVDLERQSRDEADLSPLAMASQQVTLAPGGPRSFTVLVHAVTDGGGRGAMTEALYGSVGGALIRLLPLPDPPSHPRDYHWNERGFDGGHDRYNAIAVATMEAGAPLVLAREQTRREAHVLRARVATLDGLVASVHGMDLLTSLLDGEEPPDAVPTAAIAAGEAAYQRPDVESMAEAMARHLAGSDPLSDLRAAMGVDLDALSADGALDHDALRAALGGVEGALRAALGGVEGLEGVGRDLVGLKPSQIGYFDPAHLPVPKLPIKGQAKALIKEEGEKKSMLALLTAYILVGDRAAGSHVSDVVLAIDALVGSGWKIKDAVNAMRQGERAIWNLVATAPGDGNTQTLIEHIWRYVCACESAKRYYPPQVHLEGHAKGLHVQLGIKTLVRLITEGADDEEGWAKIEAGFLKMEQEGGWEITVAVRKMRRGERRATHLLFDADPRSDGLIDIILAAVLAAEGPEAADLSEERRLADDAIVITNPQQYMAEALLCPLTLCTIEDPVIAMDGVTYEREGILSYFRHERSQGRVPRSPVSRQSLASEMLLPNRALKAIIQAHKAMDSNAALPPRPTRSNSQSNSQPVPNLVATRSNSQSSSQPVPSMSSPPVSRQPSEMPSEMPSVSRQPSEMPSEMPSVSRQPSEMPSVSRQPSAMPSVSRQPSAMPSVSRQPSAILVRRGVSATRPLDGHWPWLQWTPPGTEGEGGSRSSNGLPVSRSATATNGALPLLPSRQASASLRPSRQASRRSEASELIAPSRHASDAPDMRNVSHRRASDEPIAQLDEPEASTLVYNEASASGSFFQEMRSRLFYWGRTAEQ